MPLCETFTKLASGKRGRRAGRASYRRAYKVLNAAIGVGDADAVRTLLDDRVVDINKPPRGTPPALAVAIEARENDIVAMLLEDGADPNTTMRKSGFGYFQATPMLNLAITSGNEEAAQLLISHPQIDITQDSHLTSTGGLHGGGSVFSDSPVELARRMGMDDLAERIAAHPGPAKTPGAEQDGKKPKPRARQPRRATRTP